MTPPGFDIKSQLLTENCWPMRVQTKCQGGNNKRRPYFSEEFCSAIPVREAQQIESPTQNPSHGNVYCIYVLNNSQGHKHALTGMGIFWLSPEHFDTPPPPPPTPPGIMLDIRLNLGWTFLCGYVHYTRELLTPSAAILPRFSLFWVYSES